MLMQDVNLYICIPTCKTYYEVEKMIGDIQSTVTIHPHKIHATCQPVSASKNRNMCLDKTGDSNIIVQLDDDIEGFYKGWDKDLITPLIEDDNIGLVAARLLKKDGTYAFMSGCNGDRISPVIDTLQNHLCTACFAFRPNSIKFDEGFIKSGFEDTDYALQYKKSYNKRIVINNLCKLQHNNEMKGQSESWLFNKQYFLNKWKDHPDTWHN